MISEMIGFVDVLLAALLVGAMFGVWLLLNPARRIPGLYITLHQQGIHTLNTALPAFGAIIIIHGRAMRRPRTGKKLQTLG